MTKIGKSADELLDEKVERARSVFTPTQIQNWEGAARRDAEEGNFKPPTGEELALGIDVYYQAYFRRRYKIAKAKREA